MKLRPIAGAAVIAALALLDMPSAPVAGQSTGPLTGALIGTVVDSSGAPVAAARVHVVDTELATVSNQFGRFLFRELDPGTWVLSVSAPGYRNSAVPAIAVGAGDTIRITVTLSRTDGSAVLTTSRGLGHAASRNEERATRVIGAGDADSPAFAAGWSIVHEHHGLDCGARRGIRCGSARFGLGDAGDDACATAETAGGRHASGECDAYEADNRLVGTMRISRQADRDEPVGRNA